MGQKQLTSKTWKRRVMRGALACCAALGLGAGCASAPQAIVVSPSEQVQRDQDLGEGLAKKFEAQLLFREDPEVLKYLARLGRALAGDPVEVRVIQDRDDKWRCYGLPRAKVYLSAGLLKTIEFENELAAAIAFELAHLQRRHAVGRLETGVVDAQTPRFFGMNGLFAFSEEESVAAAGDAVNLLYQAGIDPRGLSSLWSRYERSTRRSSYGPALLRRLKESSLRTIALHAPLKNPVVRSPEFVIIRNKIGRL